MSTIGNINLYGYDSDMGVNIPRRFEDGLGYLVHHLMYAMRQRLAEECAAAGGYPMTADEFALLMILHQSDSESGLSQKVLSDTLAKDKAVITRLINSLSDKKLVVRCSGEKDRRIVYACLTKQGEQAVEALRPRLMNLLNQAYGTISEEEFLLTRKVLTRMLDNIRGHSCK